MKNYKEKYSRIKKFVNFKYDLRFSKENFEKELSPAQKREITYYHNILFGSPKTAEEQGAVNYDVYLYRPRSEKNKKKAARFAQIKGEYKKLKAIPIPRSDPDKKLKLDFSKDKLTIQEGEIKKENVLFNMMELAKNPEKEIKRAYNKVKGADAYTVMAGFREIFGEPAAGDLGSLIDNVKFKMMKSTYP